MDAAPIDQVRDWRADSQTPVATEFPLPVENPAPAQGFVATGSYRAPAADPNAAAPRKGGPGYFAFKRAFDIVFSAVVCAVLAVPVVAACVAIEIDSPGKPFFRQKRVGKGGKPIYIFKLRTMVSDAHEHPEKYMTPEQLAQWRREQKVDNDPRITHVGRFLRHTSLDELPQFINVLTGDLSVIGPRPVTLEETFEYGDARDEVLACKPGIILKGFFKESDPMLVSFEYLPCRVRFAEDPSELVFDYRLPIRSNIDHILGDEENLTRIPASLMGEGNSLLLRRAFEGAVVEAARRAAANYTLAVPQFYGGRIQLLLPLCLTGDKPELALTIQREDGFYAARTCLTLDMAYNNARLICRPETSWIKR